MNINGILTKICNDFNLGNIIQNPEKMSGGFLHFVYKICTQKSDFIIKILNPDIMKRQTALANYNNANMLEKLLQQNNINAIYYNIFDCVIFDNNKYYFYVYNYFEGQSVFAEKITKKHCEKIGDTLAKIHNISSNANTQSFSTVEYDFLNYAECFKNKDKQIYQKLKNNINILNCMCDNYNKNIKYLPQIETICHNDLDPKNVLWNNDNFAIIDLECLSYSNPYLEVFETLLQWSGINTLNINIDCFKGFKTGYFKDSKIDLNIDWGIVYYCNINMINWLGYNIKKYLENQFNFKEEIDVTKCEIIKTLDKIVFYYNNKQQLIDLMK